MRHFEALLILAVISTGTLARESYNFFFISDTHFGDQESFEMDQSVKWHFPKAANPRRCALCMPKYEAIMVQIRKGSNPSTFALIHGGDFLDGYSKTPEIHTRQFRKYLAFLKARSGLKVLIVNGNHDMFAKDGAMVYAQVMNPYIASLIGKPVDSTSNFTVWHGNDLFIFSDYFGIRGMHKCDYLVKTLNNLTKRPRYLFVVIHPNIIQYPDTVTSRLRELLVKHNAIVLCGHTHTTRLIEYQDRGGVLTQFSISTLLSPNSAQKYSNVTTDKAEFFSELAGDRFYTGKDKFGNLRHDYAKEFTAAVAPRITRYWKAIGAGFAEIKVSDAGV
ncbi:MAG: metallophosphoesterase, partial [Lentisphaeria bacterium]|nr:metallophosphoesterase [Lentisphaeria bacterium]